MCKVLKEEKQQQPLSPSQHNSTGISQQPTSAANSPSRQGSFLQSSASNS